VFLQLLLDPKSSQFSLYERVKWMKQVAEGLAWIHGAGIVHRDLKPSNVLYDAKSRTVKVCDFGLSVLLPRGDATLLDPKGTPLYVAPELVTEGPTTHSCDVFSYGIMGYVSFFFFFFFSFFPSPLL
jgi:serine/threonine-protein kinase